ncbi:MAG: ABC transporter ATP-binding protein, partial [Deltaproteobacteria bacterium]
MAARKVELIRLRQVEFQYPGGAVPSLTGIDLSVRAGELVLVTGPTGCGKSTLLKVISGIIPLESSGRFSGSVMVDSLETRQSSLPELARKVGLVFQSPNDQLCASTVMDEVAFGPQNLGLGQDEVNRRLQWALEQVGLSGHRNAQTARLSGGQKQRVVIAAQLAMGQAVLALD